SARGALFEGSKDPIEVRLGPATKASFVVLDPDGKPLLGASVSVHRIATVIENAAPESLSRLVTAVTDADGRALLPAIPPRGLAAVRVATKAYGTQEESFKWLYGPGRDVSERTIRLRPVGRLE